MERVRPTFRQRLSRFTFAITLVWTLALYKSNVTANPLSAAQKHWAAIALENPELLLSRYSEDAVLEQSPGVTDVDTVYRGQSIDSAWRDFFSRYHIQDFQVVQQQQRDRRVDAQIQITAKSSHGDIVVLSMSHQVQFDPSGKIIKEVWQTKPDLRV
ncbi:MAG TPA: hypothetical protein V6C95_05485 [Coleofasciculaceae cyanobacterium]